MKLYFIRHGDAVTSAAVDAERTLTSDGIAESETVAEILQLLKITPTAILASPYVRAQQTVEIIRKRFPKVDISTTQHLTPSSSSTNLFAEFKYYSRDSQLLLVSHEPFIRTTVSLLISADSDSKISIKKGSITCIDVTIPVQPGGGILLWLMTNPQMRTFLKAR
jgi:phosphohistidine phosphatase